MKKIVLIMLAAALTLASCTKDNTSGTNNGKTKLTMRVPSPTVQFSRAMSNQGGMHYVTDHDMRFKLQVFDKQSGEIVDEQVSVVDILTPTISFDIYLEPSVYDFLIWADFTQNSSGADMYYNTSSLKAVSKVNTGDNYVGNHAQDAYFGAVLNADLSASGYTLPGITLKRPFGRMEIYANDFDMASPTNMPAKAIITYNTSLPSEFNVATGDVTSTTLAQGEHFTNTLTLPTSGKELEVIYDYIFAAKDNNTTIGYTVALLNSSDAAISTRTMRTIPIQQNRRTIASGDFFNIEFAEDDMNVSVDDDFGGTVELDKLLIPAVTDITDITSSSFKVKWTSASLNAFTLELSPSATFATDVKRFFSIADKEFEATGLDPLTKYYVRVKTISANTGFTLTSEQTQATTLSGGTPSVTASSHMDSEKIIVPVVEVSWFDLTTPAASVKLTPTSGSAITHTLTADEITAGKATIKDENLLCATAYTVDILDAASASIISTSITTKDVSVNVTVLDGGTTAAPTDLREAVISATRTDTLFLKEGEYSIATTCAVDKNLVLIGENVATTKVSMTKHFAPAGNIDKFALSNIKFATATYFTQPSADFVLKLYKLNNCVVDLNSAKTTSSSLFASAAGTATRVIENYTIENTTIYQNAGNAYNGIFNSGSGLNNVVNEFNFKNMTFIGGNRGIISHPSTNDAAFKVNMENCTFYSVISSATSQPLISIRAIPTGVNKDNSSVTMKNTIVHIAGGAYTWFYFTPEPNNLPANQIFCDNVYYFSGQTPVFNPAASGTGIVATMNSFNGVPTDLWENPGLDPTVAGVSFKIKSGSGIPPSVGDQRWN